MLVGAGADPDLHSDPHRSGGGRSAVGARWGAVGSGVVRGGGSGDEGGAGGGGVVQVDPGFPQLTPFMLSSVETKM